MTPSYVTTLLSSVLLIVMVMQPVGATDWPMFQRDAVHSGISPDEAPDSATVIWSRQLPVDQMWGSAVISNGKVYALAGDSLWCLSFSDGSRIWAASICDATPDRPPASTPAGWAREVALPGLPRIRTCAIRASGSSDQGFAA